MIVVRLDLSPQRTNQVLYDLLPLVEKSVVGVEVRTALTTNVDSVEVASLVQRGGEALLLVKEESGAYVGIKLSVKAPASLHVDKPYPVIASGPRDTPVEDMLTPEKLRKIARLVELHHKQCHIEGDCQ